MEIWKLFGLPAHPLLVHIPVVLVPLAAIGTILIAVRPAWRNRFGPLVVVTAGVALAGVQFAIGTGEALGANRAAIGPRRRRLRKGR